MAGRPVTGTGPSGLRLEILKELQQLIDNREARDRIDRGPLAEAKGREHWVLHLLLKADEASQSHLDTLVGSAYANILARLQLVEDRVSALSEVGSTQQAEVGGRFDAMLQSVSERLDQGLSAGTAKVADTVSGRLATELGERWKPIGEALETFAVGSRQVLKDVSDTYKVATQARLLLNENARRISDLGRDILALEDALKLVVQRTIEESLGPLDRRVGQLEAQLGIPAHPRSAPDRSPEDGLPPPVGGTDA